jgi:hypothetical protein
MSFFSQSGVSQNHVGLNPMFKLQILPGAGWVPPITFENCRMRR